MVNIHWQRLQAHDVAAVAGIISAVEIADGAANRTSFAEVASYFSDSHHWYAQGAWSAGELVAFGLARTPAANTGQFPITISGGVLPSFREHGLGSELMERQLQAARILAAEIGLERSYAQVYIDQSEISLLDMAQRLGFSEQSHYIQLRRELLPPVVTELLTFIEIQPLSEQWHNEIRLAHNQVLAQTNAFAEMDELAWSERLAAMEQRWCFVAIDRFGDRPRLAGYLLASQMSSGQDSEHGPDDEGYIEEIVVLSQWRGQNIATALMARAMESFRADELRYIGLDIDISAGEDLLDVFTHFNFYRVTETHIYATEL